MKVYSIIPARSGSKGIPNKNIKLLNGIPLMAYSIRDSIACKEIDETIVTTDSEEYRKIAYEYTMKSILRPKHLSSDTAIDVDYLLHAIYTLDMEPEDIIVLLRPTTPLRKPEVLNDIITNFLRKINSRMFENFSLRSVHQIDEPPQKMFKIGDYNIAHPYMGDDIIQTDLVKQTFEPCYHPNGYIDIIRVKTILDTKTAYGKDIIIQRIKAIEIENQDDFDYVEYLLKKDKDEFKKV